MSGTDDVVICQFPPLPGKDEPCITKLPIITAMYEQGTEDGVDMTESVIIGIPSIVRLTFNLLFVTVFKLLIQSLGSSNHG